MPPVNLAFRVQASASAPWATSLTWTTMSEFTGTDAQDKGIVAATCVWQRTEGAGGNLLGRRFTARFNNNASDWDPDNTNSTIAPGILRRNAPIRLLVSDDSFTSERVLFTGFIDQITPAGTSLIGTADIRARDLLEMLSEYKVEDLVRPQELAGARIQAILDAIALPAHLTGTIDAGHVILPPATLAADALSLLQETRRSENGYLYVDPTTGALNFRDRYATLTVTAWSTSQHTVDDTGATTETPIAHSFVARNLGLRDITRVTTAGYTSRTFEYDTTATDFPPVTNRTGGSLLTQYDAQVDCEAEALHKGWDDGDTERFDVFPILVTPGNANALTALASGYFEHLTRILVEATPPGFPAAMSVDSRIEGVQLSVINDGATMRVTTSPAATVWDTESANFYEIGTTSTLSDVFAL